MAIGDVQQKNVVAADAAAAHAEPALSAVYLEPVDGKAQCADNFAIGFSPVNLGLTKIRQLLAGLRGAVCGDFAGAVQKTIKSIYVDLTGGTTHTKPGGTVYVAGNPAETYSAVIETGGVHLTDPTASFLHVDHGGVQVDNGSVVVGAPTFNRANLQSFRLSFVHTSTGGNPAQGTPLPNALEPINIPKAFCNIEMSTPNVIDSFDGAGVLDVSILVDTFVITFATPFDDTNYTVSAGPSLLIGGVPAIPTEVTRATNSYRVFFVNSTGVSIDPRTTPINNAGFTFHGRQTT